MNTDEAKKRNCACVYKIDFPDGKSYIGKTKDLKSRIGLYERFGVDKGGEVGNYIRKFGLSSCEWSILSEPKNLKGNELNLCLSVLEIYFIKKYDTLVPNGLNVSIGGEDLLIPAEYISSIGLNSKRSEIGCTPILVYDIDGNFLMEYPSIMRCAYGLGIDDELVRTNIGKKKSVLGKYIFREKKYNYVPERIDTTGIKIVNKVKYRTVYVNKYVEREVKVGQPREALVYDENGDFVGEYKSKNEALRTFTKTHSVPFGRYSNGYIVYRKVSDDYPKKIESYVETLHKKLGEVYKPMSECEDLDVSSNRNSKYEKKGWGKHQNLINDFKIRQYDDKGYEATYDNIRDAAEATGIRYSSIWACVKGITQKGGGYFWEAVDD